VLGIFDVAIKHLLEVIACSHQSVTTQSLFLNDFFHFVQVLDLIYYTLLFVEPNFGCTSKFCVLFLSIEYGEEI
jgi:hypothetical protein